MSIKKQLTDLVPLPALGLPQSPVSYKHTESPDAAAQLTHNFHPSTEVQQWDTPRQQQLSLSLSCPCFYQLLGNSNTHGSAGKSLNVLYGNARYMWCDDMMHQFLFAVLGHRGQGGLWECRGGGGGWCG